jgi:adenylate cyclase class 2
MAREREIKLRIDDLPALRRAFVKLGARVARARVHESNVLFDTSDRKLAKRQQLLRIRTELPMGSGRKAAPNYLVTFKRPIVLRQSGRKAGRHAVREEIELKIADAKALAAIFEGLGMRVWFRYEKFRTTFRLRGSNDWAKRLLLELDETPIGTFLELEGPASAIDRAARALGFTKRDYVLANYLALYQEYCRSRGEGPRDMLFAKNDMKNRGASSEKRKPFS